MVEPDAGGTHPLRLHLQLEVVRQDVYRKCGIIEPLCSRTSYVLVRKILFLNKIDLFAEKLPVSPLSDYFPDYTGGAE